MHLSSLENMRNFRRQYLSGREGLTLKILDLGSMAIGGSYRTLFQEAPWEYIGADIVSGDNVDMVLSDPYNWLEIESCSMDVVVSGQAFEHIAYFWKTMQEIARVMKPGGLCCVIAPSGGPEHRYPIDCWRFYPDGMRALAAYADLEVLSVDTHWDSQGYEDDSDQWADTVLVARKPETAESEGPSGDHLYRRDIDGESDDSLSKVIRYIQPNQRVLELGPATGYLTRYLKEELGCSVHCIEVSETMAREAEQYCDKMVIADIDSVSMEEVFAGNTYDLIVISDVLEHLRQDRKTLNACRKLLTPEGRCIVSVPNIAHAGIIGELLRGRFEYREEGLLDRTHVNFYTRMSITTLLRECGFSIVAMDRVERLPEETEFKDSLTDLPFSVQQEILNREDALTYQYIFLCEASPESRKGQGRETGQESPSVIDLRRLHLQGLNDRIDELTEALSNAQDLALERLSALRRYQKELPYAQKLALERLNILSTYQKEFPHAQKLAYERLDEIRRLTDEKKQIADQNRQLTDSIEQLREQMVTLKNQFGYRTYEKIKRILKKMKIRRADT
ncbi:MAG: methyltransferase domain-containing protein [Deltaproteobacteria bacterium]|nr:methyltransferase domain-containing protein [Deltaproteobacteria bacterium]